MSEVPETTDTQTTGTLPAPEAPTRKRPRKRVPDGGKTGRLISTRNLAGADKAKLARYRADLDAQVQGWQDRLVGDLGGRGTLSTAEMTLVQLASAKLRLALTLSKWIEERPSRVADGRDGTVRDVARDFLRASESVEKTLDRLGLKRRVVEAASLREILAGVQDADLVAPKPDPLLDPVE